MPTSPTSDEEYLSDYIQNHRVPLPELSADDSGADRHLEDDLNSIGSNGTAESDWKENWLFKKSAYSSHDTPTLPTPHVGMLVPSPTEDVKAQIGDQTTDEVSDLSEAGSDVESDLSDTEHSLMPSVLYPDSLISQSTLNGPLLEAKNENVLLVESEPNLEIVANQIQLSSDEEIRKSIETLDAVVNAAEHENAINEGHSATTKSNLVSEENIHPTPAIR